MNNERGIILLNAYGLRFCERLAVSLFTLRHHWTGPITIYADTITEELTRRIAKDVDADVQIIEPAQGHHACYVTKTRLPAISPYDETLLIDADTVIVGKIDELFGHPITLTQFSTWVSTGRKVSARILWLRGKSPFIDACINEQLSREHPAVNTGVICWQKGQEWLGLWNAITEANAGIFILDEVAAQCLSNHPAVHILDHRYNASPVYSQQIEDVRIWHAHGDKHYKKPEGRAIWEPALRDTVQANIGGIREWLGQWDKTTRGIKAEQFA